MPVQKFRRVEDMPAPWRNPGDPALFRVIEGLWRFGQQWTRPRFPPGVHKRRSMEEMNRLDEEWAAANFEAFQARQAAARSSSSTEPAPSPSS